MPEAKSLIDQRLDERARMKTRNSPVVFQLISSIRGSAEGMLNSYQRWDDVPDDNREKERIVDYLRRILGDLQSIDRRSFS